MAKAEHPQKTTRHTDDSKADRNSALLGFARLLGRQAAREAFRATRTDSQVINPAPATPATTTDEE